MQKPIVSVIAAIATNRVIGHGNQLLWHIAEDMKYFREVTRGHVVVMGRKTFESIGRPLPNRLNIVITRDQSFSAEGVMVCHSLEEALDFARQNESEEIFIIGGAQIYTQALPFTDRLYLTVVHKNFEGEAVFPEHKEFTKVVSQKDSRDENVEYTFLVLERPSA